MGARTDDARIDQLVDSGLSIGKTAYGRFSDIGFVVAGKRRDFYRLPHGASLCVVSSLDANACAMCAVKPRRAATAAVVMALENATPSARPWLFTTIPARPTMHAPL